MGSLLARRFVEYIETERKAGVKAGVAAAVCAVLAGPAAGQDSLRGGLDGMAQEIASLLNREANRTGDPLRVSFRPARTGPQRIDVYCGPLSSGLPNALHEGVQSWQDRMNLSSFEVAVAEERAHVPPEVTMSWTWDGEESIEVETHVYLPGRNAWRDSATLAVEGLNGAQRECLFTFRPGGGRVEAKEAGFLREEPTYDVERIAREFDAGERFRVVGVLSSEHGVASWAVVQERDPNMGGYRNLFAEELARDAAGRADPVPVDPGPSDPEYSVGAVFRDCDHCPEMVVVPSGAFIMGSPSSEAGRDGDEGPQHRVSIGSPFAVGVYEVTFEEWDACVLSGGCGGYHPDDEGWGRGRRPVMNVSWEDAQAYVGWLSRETGGSYRLLSESEWEYAARAGTTTQYWWGDDIGRNRANCYDCGSRWGGESTAPVGSFSANAFGLHDVHGNVWEWTQDCWNDSYAGAPGDGSAWESGECYGRVLRGGSWLYDPRDLRSAARYWIDSGVRYYGLGFRVARTFTP